ncbi:MAG TPA: hypothetical protein VF549_05125 [Solirubrobacteraceae bacterium]|jgi:uncharacterized membrane protein YgcG
MSRRRRHDIHDDAFEAFAEDVRSAVPSPPGEETARRHLAAMRAAAAEAAQVPAPGAGRRERVGRRRSAGPLRPVLRLGAVTAGALAVFSGASTALAAIGVELPEPVRAPFEAVGIELPNQPDDGGEGTTPPAGSKRRNPGQSPQHRRDGEHRPPAEGERGRSEGHRRDGGHRRSKKGPRGNSEQHRQDSSHRQDGSSDNGNGNGAGSGGASNRGNGRGSAGSSNGRKSGASKSRPANPAPNRSTRRGSGPTRPIKPNPPRDRATKQPKAKPVPPPATEPEPVPEAPPADADATTTSP